MNREYLALYNSYSNDWWIVFKDDWHEDWAMWLNVGLPKTECKQMVEALNKEAGA